MRLAAGRGAPGRGSNQQDTLAINQGGVALSCDFPEHGLLHEACNRIPAAPGFTHKAPPFDGLPGRNLRCHALEFV
jgi:hypothetical protein